MPVKDDFPGAILAAREAQGQQQIQAALRAHIDVTLLCRIERGKRQATPAAAGALTRAYRSRAVGQAYCAGCPVGQALREIAAREGRSNLVPLREAA